MPQQTIKLYRKKPGTITYCPHCNHPIGEHRKTRVKSASPALQFHYVCQKASCECSFEGLVLGEGELVGEYPTSFD